LLLLLIQELIVYQIMMIVAPFKSIAVLVYSPKTYFPSSL
jgi:hypothetical protein